MKKREKVVWIMTGSLSSKCNRGCSHCMDSANMENGSFFSVENARHLARDIKNEQTKVNKRMDLFTELRFASNGEPLLNPDLPEIFEILFGENPKNTGFLVSSGVDSKSPLETERLLKILRSDYVSRIRFSLSFNLFEKGFSKRLIGTLKLLFENGVRKVSIKICQPNQNVLLTKYKLENLLYAYFIKWIREVDPLASYEAMYDKNLGEEVNSLVPQMVHLKSKRKTRNRKKPFRARPLSTFEMAASMVIVQSVHCRTLGFLTKYGEIEIRIAPHYLLKRGRALLLRDSGYPPRDHLRLCSFLAGNDRSGVHFGADGYYYPGCDCPNSRHLRIGRFDEDGQLVYERFLFLRKKLFEAFLCDGRMYDDACQFCQKVAAELYHELRNKPLR